MPEDEGQVVPGGFGGAGYGEPPAAGSELDRKAIRSLRRNGDLAFEPPFSRQKVLMATLARRRKACGRNDFGLVGSMPPPDVLVSAGELLLRQRDWDAGVSSMLEPAGWVERPIAYPELDSRLVRLANPDVPVELVEEVARALRQRGIAASVSHVTPLAPVGKALGGAEPASPLAVLPTPVPGRIHVGVVDSGLAPEPRKDGWLEGIARDGNLEDVLGQDGYLTRAAGHGTFTTGIVQRVAPTARISMFKADLDDGLASEIDVARAMIDAVKADPENPVRILNLSFGSPTSDQLPPLALAAAMDAIEEYEADRDPDQRVLMIAAAGNYGDERPVWPGAFRRVVAVAGLDADGHLAHWSSRGFWVDASVTGEAIRSTYVTGKESPDFDPDHPDEWTGDDPWALWTGSSFAAPQLTGAVAARCEARGETPRQALGALLANRRTVPGGGVAVDILPSAAR